ncbi:hypothetical protein [Pedobacter immunditicola]|uniref:hypothetical protein n=1 Tax=Pedobacter immunditicola TaxID=3133440 RepID=UPI0030AB4812
MRIASLSIILLLLINSCARQAPNNLADSTEGSGREIYINSIDYFPETAEFYVALNVKQGVEFDWDKVTALTDSITYQDDETVRRRLPMSIARQYFDTNLLDTLDVFSHLHKRISGVNLTRVEYYEPTMENYFIAVFKAGKQVKIDNEPYYCTSPTKESRRSLSSEYIADTLLTARLKKELNIKSIYHWVPKHVQVKGSQNLYSIFSFQEQSGNVSYLTELNGNKLNLLYKQTDEYSFWDILPLPLYQHSKPILLITMAVPDTDSSLEYVPFVFDGTKYVPFYNNRVNLTK